MVPEFGHFALILAFTLALVQSILPMIGAIIEKQSWMLLARPAAIGGFVFTLISFFSLMYAFVTNDFSVAYVAQNSNTNLPLFYKITALWSAHEGSMLLWVTVLSFWTCLVAIFSRSLPLDMVARVLSILGLISIGFLLFILTTSDPFLRLLPNFPVNGQSLNPLLQDPGLAIHPPMLYIGYVGFSVAFAFAVAALIGGRLDVAWARWSRPWTLAAWCFLTFGITLGSWWSYRVLGWGGWWFWDPVENASFLPWLTGTALVHSLIVAEKRGAFKSWTVLLAICAFALSLMGTFLVRSGILVSVHAFAVDPSRGAYMLKFLLIVIGVSLLIYAWRANQIKGRGNFALLSRETMLLTNNVILMVAMATVLLGTLYPLVLQSLNLGKISVGPPYFNIVFIPLIIFLLFFMAIGPQASWQQMTIKDLLEKFWFVFVISLFLGLMLPWIFTGNESFAAALGLFLSLWIIFSTVQGSYRLHKKLKKSKVSLSHYGMVIAHIGLAVTVIGITLTSVYSVEKDVRLSPSQSTTIHGYTFKFVNISSLQGKNYNGFITKFNVEKNNQLIATLYPQKRLFSVQQEGISEPGISRGIFLDFYVALGEKIGTNAWALRIYYKPFVRWIWAGGVIMMLGGFLSMFDKRYRIKRQVNIVKNYSKDFAM